MHTSLAPQPDLDTPPWMLLLVAAICFAVWALLWLHDRRAAAHRAAYVAYVLGQPQDVRGHRASAACMGRDVHGDRSSSPRDVDRARTHELELDDSEVVALARYFAVDRKSRDLGTAVAKIERAAYEIILADRAARR